MNRHEVRKEVFKAVFMNEFHDASELEESVDLFLKNRDIAEEEDLANNNKSPEDEEYIRTKVAAIAEKKDEIDEFINSNVEGWKTSRMARVDLTLIRLAVYEFKYEELPVGVAINEAVNLADEFGTDSSASFVNGVLARLSR